jgi:hypothetical protein
MVEGTVSSNRWDVGPAGVANLHDSEHAKEVLGRAVSDSVREKAFWAGQSSKLGVRGNLAVVGGLRIPVLKRGEGGSAEGTANIKGEFVCRFLRTLQKQTCLWLGGNASTEENPGGE